MKAKVTGDKRPQFDKMWDDLWNAMVKAANLNPRQAYLVRAYVRELMGLRIHEIEAAVEMGFLIALIEGEKFGTDVKRGASRLIRVQKNAVEARNEAYGHDCIDANGTLVDYDGCGIEHMKVRLRRHGVEYETKF